MSVSVDKLIRSFEELPPADQKEAAAEILRRTVSIQFPPLSDEELVLNAEEIFLDLDRREAADAKSK